MVGSFVGSETFFDDTVNAAKKTIKDAPGMLHALRLVNTTGAAAYLQFFDKLLADVIVGTTVPDFCVRLGANESAPMSIPLPKKFKTGMTIAGTTTAGGNLNAAISVLAFFE